VQNIPFLKKNTGKKKELEDDIDDEEPLNEDIRDKILRFVRDYIISKNLTVREAF